MELLKSICSLKLLKKADLLTWWAVKLLPSMTRISVLGRHSCPRWLYLITQWRPVKVLNVGCWFPQGHCLRCCTCFLKMVPGVRKSTNKRVCLRKIKICTGLVAQSCPIVVAPWTVAHQASPPLGFSRQEYWSGLPLPSPGDLPDPGIDPGSPALWINPLLSEPPGNPLRCQNSQLKTTALDQRIPGVEHVKVWWGKN